MTPAVIASTQSLALAFRRIGKSAHQAAIAFAKMARALILIDAHWKAGEWPDYYSLLNRYMRTDRLPKCLTGERWEV